MQSSESALTTKVTAMKTDKELRKSDSWLKGSDRKAKRRLMAIRLSHLGGIENVPNRPPLSCVGGGNCCVREKEKNERERERERESEIDRERKKK